MSQMRSRRHKCGSRKIIAEMVIAYECGENCCLSIDNLSNSMSLAISCDESSTKLQLFTIISDALIIAI